MQKISVKEPRHRGQVRILDALARLEHVSIGVLRHTKEDLTNMINISGSPEVNRCRSFEMSAWKSSSRADRRCQLLSPAGGSHVVSDYCELSLAGSADMPFVHCNTDISGHPIQPSLVMVLRARLMK